MVSYSDPIQLDTSSGLWYKFGYEILGNDIKWHILSSGDKDSLEKNSVIYHDHFWQSNGHWYFQGRLRNQHIIGKDELKEGIERQNKRGRLELTEAEKQHLDLTSGEELQLTETEVNKLAIYRACQAYGNSGYGGSNHGIEVDNHVAHILDRQVQQYQASIFTNYPQSTTQSLHWRDAQEDTSSSSQSTTQSLHWRDAQEDTSSSSQSTAPNNPQLLLSNQFRKSTRRMTR